MSSTRTPRATSAPAEELQAADEALSRVFVALDRAVGQLQEPEHGAALRLRDDIDDLKRRLEALRIFVGAAVVAGSR